MSERLLRLEAVEDRIGLKKSKIYMMVSAGEFPRPVKLGNGHINGWPENEVTAWIKARIAERGEAVQ